MLIRTYASILFKTEDIIFFPLIRKIKNKDIECTKRLKKKKWTEMRHSIVHVNWIAHVHYSHLVETKGKCFSYCPFFFFCNYVYVPCLLLLYTFCSSIVGPLFICGSKL